MSETANFTSDDDALEFLLLWGIKERRNGIIQEDRRIFTDETWAAVKYLCDEWDFDFIDEAEFSPSDELIIAALREGFIYHSPNGKNVVPDHKATKRLMAYAADRLEKLLAHSQALPISKPKATKDATA
jgi:hypothetical protein